jgi:hypothetical protein
VYDCSTIITGTHSMNPTLNLLEEQINVRQT